MNVRDNPDTRPVDSLDAARNPRPEPETRSIDEGRLIQSASSSEPIATHRRYWPRVAAAGLVLIALAAMAAGIESFVMTVAGRAEAIGWLASAGAILLIAALGAACVNEVRALDRLRRIEGLRQRTTAVRNGEQADDPAVVDTLCRLYEERSEAKPALQRFRARAMGVGDAGNQIAAFDTIVLANLDEHVEREAIGAIRRTFTATAISPFAWLSASISAWTNLRLVRKIAAINGGRPGTLATVRLMRTAFTNVLMAGVFESAEDAIHDIVGHSLAGRVSTTMAAAATNGLLTARLAVAAADACRPIPWSVDDQPNARRLVRRALSDDFKGDTNFRETGEADHI